MSTLDRPDPITPKVATSVTIGTVLAAVAAVLIDLGWDAPAGNNLMDWVRSLLPVVLAVAGAVYGAGQAKKETTPLESPMNNEGQLLYPEGIAPPHGSSPIETGY